MNCPICKSDNTKRLFGLDENSSVVRCGNCGIAWTDPLPEKEEISRLYPEEYHGKGGRQRFIPAVELLIRLSRRKRAVEITRINPGIHGRILDIGCGRGWMLSILKKWGWEVFGTELSRESSTFAREKLKLNIFTKEVGDCSFPESHFDIVTMWHVLEHMTEPALVLNEANRILKGRGVLIVEVPNFGGLQANVFGNKWFHLDPPRHLFHFSDRALERILNASGFKVVKRKNLSWEYDPFGFVQSVLNLICFRSNYLYDFLRSKEGRMIKGHTFKCSWDLFVSLVLCPFLLAASLIIVPLSSMIGKGGVIRYHCVKADSRK